MLDAKLLRTDPEAVARNLARRGFVLDVERFRALEERRRNAQVAADETRAARNAHAKKVGMAKGKGEDITALVAEGEALARKLESLRDGTGRRRDRVRRDRPRASQHAARQRAGRPRRIGECRSSSLGHAAAISISRRSIASRRFGEKLSLIDFERPAVIGARFVVLKDGVARLHRALIQYMLDLHTTQHGYTEVYAPYLVARQALVGTGQLPKFEADLFRVVSGRAGVLPDPDRGGAVTDLARESILEANTLPRKYAAHTPCFRSEAGSYGKDTRGMIRQHQFEKVELVHIVRPEDSYAALEELTGNAEKVLQGLDLPYRVVALCSGDVGFGSAKTYDLEVWLPGPAEVSRDPRAATARRSRRGACRPAGATRRRQARAGAHVEWLGRGRRMRNLSAVLGKLPAGGRQRRRA